uniref:Uncharacterized protein n=1 Tax=viral metagenome TaxID=1070528 RepID=A0A6H2A4Z4_9ZZZZ
MNNKEWLEIICKNGKINKAQVLRELSDYSFLIEQASKVYCHFTNLSKTNYYANTIISIIEEKTYDREITQEDIGDILKSGLNKKDLIKEIKEYFDLPTPNHKER